MMIQKLEDMGVTSTAAYAAAAASIGMSVASWLVSRRAEAAGNDRADRWGIYVGMWAPTLFGLGNALKLEESQRR